MIKGLTFNAIHQAALKSLAKELAAEFEVSESTVLRWAKGTARPHPRIRNQVIASIQGRR